MSNWQSPISFGPFQDSNERNYPIQNKSIKKKKPSSQSNMSKKCSRRKQFYLQFSQLFDIIGMLNKFSLVIRLCLFTKFGLLRKIHFVIFICKRKCWERCGVTWRDNWPVNWCFSSVKYVNLCLSKWFSSLNNLSAFVDLKIFCCNSEVTAKNFEFSSSSFVLSWTISLSSYSNVTIFRFLKWDLKKGGKNKKMEKFTSWLLELNRISFCCNWFVNFSEISFISLSLDSLSSAIFLQSNQGRSYVTLSQIKKKAIVGIIILPVGIYMLFF